MTRPKHRPRRGSGDANREAREAGQRRHEPVVASPPGSPTAERLDHEILARVCVPASAASPAAADCAPAPGRA